jgi:hypothetical protein
MTTNDPGTTNADFDALDLMESLTMTKVQRRTSASAVWVKGSIGGIEFRAIEFETAYEAIQWTEADGRGAAVMVDGKNFVVGRAEADLRGSRSRPVASGRPRARGRDLRRSAVGRLPATPRRSARRCRVRWSCLVLAAPNRSRTTCGSFHPLEHAAGHSSRTRNR